MDGQAHEQLRSVAETCADEGELLALSITRFIAAGYMTGDVACWDAAHNSAEDILGPTAGSQFVAAMATLMRAIRTERQTDWRFLPAPCCRVTDDEFRLVRLIALAGRRRWDEVRREAAVLAHTKDAPRISRAVQAVADAVESVRTTVPERSGSGRPKATALH
jgi:hypothetical protein